VTCASFHNERKRTAQNEHSRCAFFLSLLPPSLCSEPQNILAAVYPLGFWPHKDALTNMVKSVK
jgi:hypothetical protein